MKKRVGIVAIILVMLLACSACGSDTGVYHDYISEIRDNIYAGESEHFEVTVFTGEREQPYALDGVAKPMVDYCLVTVVPKFDAGREDTVTCKLTVDGKKYIKKLSPHPFNGSFTADFADLDIPVNAISVNVTAQHYDEDVAATSLLTADCMGFSEALEKGLNHLSASIENTKEGEDYLCEIQIKLVHKTRVESRLYWHVLVADRSGGIFAVLIDCKKPAESPEISG